ncbi:MAG: hypothetical protein AB1455_09855 [Pseudomonadota bacterium]
MSEANSMDCTVGQSVPSESDRALWDAMGCIADDEACLTMLSAHIASAVAAERDRHDTLRKTARAFYNATVAAPGVRITSNSKSLTDAAKSAGEDLRAALLATLPNTINEPRSGVGSIRKEQ